jgi:MFS transporter, VNT family, synaptic vesicle glycoprotein 2
VSSHLWGFLSDTYGRKRVLIIASLSAFVASVLSSLSLNLYYLAFFRLLNGLFISGSTSVIFAYLGEFFGEKNRSRSVMAASVIFALFCMAFPVMAWVVINQKWSFVIPLINVNYRPWRLFLIASGFPCFISGIALIFFPESPKYTFSQVKMEYFYP